MVKSHDFDAQTGINLTKNGDFTVKNISHKDVKGISLVYVPLKIIKKPSDMVPSG